MAADTGDTLTAISQWAYPFPQKDASAAIDPDAYLAALQGSDGPFPLGLNGLWHGGIHFDQEGGLSFPRFFAFQRSRVMQPHPWSAEL
ncbi:hypothetical protein [Burkholderia gladioli]|uniref:hypothetical protein n=1 Tax=Burkholderia gladioli TaxID=28095 RepID=UPI0016422CDC|nr:hypothetical protein [Burkholderia gladioli]